MRINTQYIEHLNDFIMWNKKNKNAVDTSNLEVLQIGVGGFTSCGKTLLIDSIFSLFSEETSPNYLPKNFSGKLSPQNSLYPTYIDLLDFVRKKETQADLKTLANTKEWDENTYEGVIDFCNKQKRLIIRNIPGEIFDIFFNEIRGIEKRSFHSIFMTYCSSNNVVYKGIYKQAKKEEIEKIKNNFYQSTLKTYGNKNIKDADLKESSDLFFEYLFYLSSDYNIYCLKATEKRSEALESDKSNIARQKEINHGNVLYCVSQFDRIIDRECYLNSCNEKTVFDNILNQEKTISRNSFPKTWNQFINITSKIWSGIIKHFDDDEKDNNVLSNQDDNLTIYWKRQARLYEEAKCIVKDTKSSNTKIINEFESWENIFKRFGGVIKMQRYPYFFSSTAFHNDEDVFYDYDNDGNEDQRWNKENIMCRTSLGVIEMMLYILKNDNFDISLSNIPYSSENYKIIANKILGN